MNLYGLKVIDFHSHFPRQSTGRSASWRARMVERYGERRTDIILENSRRYRDEWRKMWAFDESETSVHTDEEQAERWVADMDAKGLSRVNFVMGGGNDNLSKIVSWRNLLPVSNGSGSAPRENW